MKRLVSFVRESPVWKLYETQPVTLTFLKEYNGWGNGYVVLPEDHPFYKVDYTKIPVNAPGGLTFSRHTEELIRNIDDWKELPSDAKGWVVGFDTGHTRTAGYTKEMVEQETNKLKLQLLNLYNYEKDDS